MYKGDHTQSPRECRPKNFLRPISHGSALLGPNANGEATLEAPSGEKSLQVAEPMQGATQPKCSILWSSLASPHTIPCGPTEITNFLNGVPNWFYCETGASTEQSLLLIRFAKLSFFSRHNQNFNFKPYFAHRLISKRSTSDIGLSYAQLISHETQDYLGLMHCVNTRLQETDLIEWETQWVWKLDKVVWRKT